jgi:hypothetical protein
MAGLLAQGINTYLTYLPIRKNTDSGYSTSFVESLSIPFTAPGVLSVFTKFPIKLFQAPISF